MTRSLPLCALAVVSLALSACSESAAPTSAAPGTPAASSGIAGNYKIASATNPGGAGGYAGTVQVAPQGDHFTIAWTIANAPAFKGVGIVEGSTLGVGWGTGTNYGVAVYKVDGGTLTGKWATYANQGKAGTESLSGPAGLNGEYKIVASTTPGTGKAYAGTVTIAPKGTAYSVTWKLPNETYSGVGILSGNVLVVGWGTGGGEAGAVSYNIAGGKLDGKWAQPGGSALGTEVLQKN
jgi:hypothetical protein